MKKGEPVGGNLLTPAVSLCLVLTFIAIYYLAKRFIFGLGSVTNMSDGYPWGIWITYDVVVGTALGCGGYAMGLLVYVFNKGEYHPLVRPALLASLMGYSLAGFSVFIDIGRYWHIYNLFLPWYANLNSVLLEVALCIGAYCLVMWIEFTPVFLQKLGLDNLNKKLDKIMFFVIAIGILLPTMHQSSLGSVMIIAGSKLSPLWWTPILPLLFLISAITMGYAFVLFESSITTLRHKTPDENHLLDKISSLFPWLTGIYLIIRFIDIVYRGQLSRVFEGDMLGNLFLLENIAFLIPMIVLALPTIRNSKVVLFFSAVSLLIAGALYRFNTYIVGFNPGDNWTYFPAMPELFITLGIVSVELMVYLWFIKRLPVFERV